MGGEEEEKIYLNCDTFNIITKKTCTSHCTELLITHLKKMCSKQHFTCFSLNFLTLPPLVEGGTNQNHSSS